jgi:hypothetical protein
LQVEVGATAIEYGLIAALFSVVTIAAINAISTWHLPAPTTEGACFLIAGDKPSRVRRV